MALALHLSDVLPSFFASAVERLTGEALLDVERHAVLEGLLNSLRWSILRRAGEDDASSSRPDVTSLTTADRFADQWLSRREIVSRIVHTSGLAGPLARLALFLIETRIDLALTTDVEHEVSIEQLGRIRAADTSNQSSLDPATHSRLLETPDWNRSIWSWLGGRRALARRLTRAVSGVELAEAVRWPRPYVIDLAPTLVFKPHSHEHGPEWEWPETDDKTIRWSTDEMPRHPRFRPRA